jgi:hypothetical protein
MKGVYLENADIIMGHFRPQSVQGSFVEALRNNNNFTRHCAEWTMLRQTPARVTSTLHFFWAKERNHTGCVEAHSRDPLAPCRKFFHPMHLRDLLHNGVCRYFTPTAPHWHMFEHPSLTCNVSGAIGVLSKLDYVGLMEESSHYYDKLNQFFGIVKPLAHKGSTNIHTHKNRRKIKRFEEFSDRLQGAILRTNADDLLIDNWCTAYFKEHYYLDDKASG